MMDVTALKSALNTGRVIISTHASQEAQADALNLTFVRASVIDNGVEIEDYPTDPRGPSYLVLSVMADGRPVHTC